MENLYNRREIVEVKQEKILPKYQFEGVKSLEYQMGASLQSLGLQAKSRTNLVEYVDRLIPENNKSFRESLI